MNMQEVSVGMAATVSSGSDRNPATVVEVSGNIVVVQEDGFKVVSGGEHDGSAEYEYSRNERGFRHRFRWRNGRFERLYWNGLTGRWNKSDYGRLHLGSRQRYYDPHF